MFFKKFLSFFNSKINMIFNINDNKSVRNFLLFFLKNNYCKLLYYIYIVMWILFILIGIEVIINFLK